MTLRKLPRLAVWIALLTAAATSHAALIPFAGYENPAPVKPGTELKAALALGRTFTLPLQRLTTDRPPWDTAGGPERGLAQAYFLVGSQDGSDDARHMVVRLFARDPEVTSATLSFMDVFRNPEQYILRVALDLNGNQVFEPGEIKNAELRRNPSNPNILNPFLSFKLPEIQNQGGQPVPITVTGPIYVFNTFTGPVNQHLQQTLGGMRLEATLPLISRFSVYGKEVELRLRGQFSKDGFVLTRYAFAESQQASERPGGNEPEIGEGWLIAGHWLAIKRVAGDFSSVTLAELSDAAPRPSRAQVGEPLPGFTRVDVLTRKVISTPRLRDKSIVLVLSGYTPGNMSSKKYLYNSYRLMAERLHQELGERVEFICVQTAVDWNSLLAQLGGRPDPLFRLLLDRDVREDRDFIPDPAYQSGAAPEAISSLVWANLARTTTLVAGPDGKILLREEKELSELLPRILKMLK